MKTRHRYQSKVSRKKTRRRKGGSGNTTAFTSTPKPTALPATKTQDALTIENGEPQNNNVTLLSEIERHKEDLYHFVNDLSESDENNDKKISDKYWEIHGQLNKSSQNPQTKATISKLIRFFKDKDGYDTYTPKKGGTKPPVSIELLKKVIDIFTRLNTDPIMDPGLSEIKNFVFPEGKMKSSVSNIPTTIRKTTEIIAEFNKNRGETLQINTNIEDDEYMFDAMTSVEEWFRIAHELANGKKIDQETPPKEAYTFKVEKDASFMGPPRSKSSSGVNPDQEESSSPTPIVSTIINKLNENITDFITPQPNKQLEIVASSKEPELVKQTKLLNILQEMLTRIKDTDSKEREGIEKAVNELKRNVISLSKISNTLANQNRVTFDKKND